MQLKCRKEALQEPVIQGQIVADMTSAETGIQGANEGAMVSRRISTIAIRSIRPLGFADWKAMQACVALRLSPRLAKGHKIWFGYERGALADHL